MLDEAERNELLLRARLAAARALGLPAGRRALPVPAGRLAAPGAAFVTWKRGGRLRGCIGSVEARRPLAEDVEGNAVAALTRDPRFAPSPPRDLPQLTLSVSVLGPLEKVDAPEAIEVGRHGAVVEKGSRRALFLPQVAVEWGWDLSTFLGQLCLKAGLPEDAWAKGATLYRFEAEVFEETVPEAARVPSA